MQLVEGYFQGPAFRSESRQLGVEMGYDGNLALHLKAEAGGHVLFVLE